MTKLTIFFVLIVNFLSGLFAGSGLFGLTRETPHLTEAADAIHRSLGLLSAEGWHFAMCLAATGLLQAGITIIWTNYFRHKGLTPFSIGLGFSFGSAWLTAAFVVLAGESILLQQQARQDAVAPARTALVQFSESLSRASVGLNRASERASELAETEREQGGTCPGSTLRGPGPRERMRDRHAAVLGDTAHQARALSEAALQLDIDLQLAASGADLQAVFQEAVRLSRSPVLEDLRRDLAPIRSDLTDGWEDGGHHYECPTPDFLQRVEDAITHLDGIMVVPTDVPIDTPPSTTDANRLIWSSLGALVQGTAPASDLALLAIFVAFLIELIQIGMLRRREVILRQRGLVEDGYETAWRGGKGRARQRPQLHAVTTALDRFTWYDGWEEYLAVPRDREASIARVPIAFFGLKPAHRALRNFDLGRVDPDWVAARGLQGAYFDLYALPRDLNAWRRLADRDLFHGTLPSPPSVEA